MESNDSPEIPDRGGGGGEETSDIPGLPSEVRCCMDNIQRVDNPADARTARKGLLQKRLEEDLC